MGSYNLPGIGTVNITSKRISCDFSISSEEFFRRFSDLSGLLSSKTRATIEDAINSRKEEKIKNPDEAEEFFSRVQQRVLEEKERRRREEEKQRMQEQEMEEEQGYEEEPSEEEESTEETGEKEITGYKVPIEITEQVKAKFTYNYLAINEPLEEKTGEIESEPQDEEDTEELEEEDQTAPEKLKEELPEGYGILTRDGKVLIKNISSDQRIWDLKGVFSHNGEVEGLPETFSIKELNAEEEKSYEYSLSGEKEPALKIEEFISTINDPNTLTYSLIIDQENIVYFRITIKNLENFPIKNIVMKKKLFENYGNLEITSLSAGEYRIEDGILIWEIDTLEVEKEETLEFTQSITIEDKEQKIRSGQIEVQYEADSSLSELTISEFEGYGNNRYLIIDEQIDDEPDFYEGYLEFYNLSPYVTKLKSLSIKLADTGQELIELDPEKEYLVSANDKWTSNTWKIDTQGEIPEYVKSVNFILLPEVSSTLSTAIELDDLELAVAIFEASIKYDIEAIPSNREVPFDTIHTLVNGGAAPFDYLSIKHIVPEHFKPPLKDEIKLIVDGEEKQIDPSWITITPEDQESDREHEIFIELDNLRLTDIGMIQPSQKVEIIYPLIADNLSKDEALITNAEWTANTYPRGEPIVITETGEEATKIEVIHRRIRILRGKSVLATEDPNVYEVVLEVTNNSNYTLPEYLIRDRIPDNFDAQDFSMEPAEHSEHDGKEVVIWKIEDFEPGKTIEIRYKLVASNEEASAKEAQFSM